MKGRAMRVEGNEGSIRSVINMAAQANQDAEMGQCMQKHGAPPEFIAPSATGAAAW
jgi:hypothetical protein